LRCEQFVVFIEGGFNRQLSSRRRVRLPHGLAWAHPKQRPAWSQYSLTIAPSAVRRRVMICLPQPEQANFIGATGRARTGARVGRRNTGSCRLSKPLSVFTTLLSSYRSATCSACVRSIPVVPHYFDNLSPVLGPTNLPGVPDCALQPGALLLKQRMIFVRKLQHGGIDRLGIPGDCQEHFDRRAARELVEIDSGQFAKFRGGGAVLSLTHS